MTDHVFLSQKDLIKINGYSQSSASREMQYLRDVLNKKKIPYKKRRKIQHKTRYQPITIKEFCELYALSETLIRKTLLK